jgi:hypothetical protein
MTRSKLLALVVAPFAVVLLAAWSSSSGTTQRTSVPTKAVTVKVVEHQTSLMPAGNTLTLTNDLLQNGKTIGSNQVGCFLTGPGSMAECFAASVLPKGQILSQASITIPPPTGTTVTAIVGGTGAYSTARGTIDSVRTSDTSDTTVTFHIVLV